MVGLLKKIIWLSLRVYHGSIWRIRQLKRKIQNRAFDFIYTKDNLGEFGPSEYAEFGAHPAQSSGIWLLSYIFRKIYHIKPSDVLVDVGCGQGRVILWWLSQRYNNKIIGLEIDENIAKAAGKRLDKYHNVQIITGGAIENIPSDGTLFYLFNPFGADQMKRFKTRLEEMFLERGNVTIVYYYCRQIDIFRNDPLWTIDEIRHPELPKNYKPPMPWAAIIKMVER